MKKTKKLLKCDICGDVILPGPFGWSHGNNAEPLVKNGRCCNECDTYVLIARLRMIRAQWNKPKE